MLKEVYRIGLSGFTYDGKRKEGQGRDPIINKGSKWETMIADYNEGGMSFPDVQTVVNTICLEQGLVLYRLPAIKGVIERRG